MENYIYENGRPISIRTMDLSSFFNKVYLTMGAGLVLSFLTSFLFYFFDWTVYISQMLMWVIIIVQFALLIFLTMKLQLSTAYQPEKTGLSKGMATGLFMVYCALMGITLSVIFYAYAPNAIMITMFTTMVMFISLSIVGRVTDKDLSSMGKFLFVALIGLIVCMIINIFMKSDSFETLISIIGVVIFSGLIVYDNNKLKLMYNNGFVNESNLVVFGALQLYLDFINLFLYLLRLFGNRD